MGRLDALLGSSVPGFYGTPDPYTGVTNQALALLGLVASGATPPTAAVEWLAAQQCTAPAASAGAWQGYRAPSGGGYEPCRTSDPTDFQSPESNSTAVAVEALVAVGATTDVPAALAWLQGIQVASGPATGGFGQYPGGPADPNSTVVVIQAVVAAGQDPAGTAWAAGGGTPASSLTSWQLTSGPDAGALSSPYSGGYSDLYATYQGVWGLAAAPFPLPVIAAPAPSTTTTTSGPAAPPSTTRTTPAPVVAAVVVSPRFTG